MEKEGHVQMVKYWSGSGRNQEAKKILTALGFMGDVIANRRHLKLEENQEANIITKKAISELRETNKIRELYRVICIKRIIYNLRPRRLTKH